MKKIFISFITVIVLSSLFTTNINALQGNNNVLKESVKLNDTTVLKLKSGENATYIYEIDIPSCGYFTYSLKGNNAIWNNYFNSFGFYFSESKTDYKNSYYDNKEYNTGTDIVFSNSDYYRGGKYYFVFSPKHISTRYSYVLELTIKTSFKKATVSFQESLTKNNDYFKDAFKIGFDKTYNALRERKDSKDCYKFELKDKYTNPHLYVKETENNSIKCVYIYNTNKDLLFSSGVNTVLDIDLNKELTKGTYYLYVEGDSTGKYSFKLTKTYFGWMQGKYWYENGVRQAVLGDPKNITDTIYGHERGREIYDPDSDGWYWLDAVYDGAKATSKEVWMPYIYQNEKPGSTLGKWVRYDENGKMYKGLVTLRYWQETPSQNGNTYYYEPITGEMIKGYRNIDGKDYYFDETSGVLR